MVGDSLISLIMIKYSVLLLYGSYYCYVTQISQFGNLYAVSPLYMSGVGVEAGVWCNLDTAPPQL